MFSHRFYRVYPTQTQIVKEHGVKKESNILFAGGAPLTSREGDARQRHSLERRHRDLSLTENVPDWCTGESIIKNHQK